MTDADNGGIAFFLDLLPGGWVVARIDAADRLVDRFHFGQMLGEPVLHRLQKDVGIVETAIDNVDGAAVERIEAWREGPDEAVPGW